MADTSLTLRSNRYQADAFLSGAVASVAIDATVVETFFLPVGFGQLLLKFAAVHLGSMSGAYVAPGPAYDGAVLQVLSSDLSTDIDYVGAERWVTRSDTGAGQPTLSASFDLNNRILVRQSDRFAVYIPASAGAGVTGTVSLFVRGIRIQTA